MKVIYDPVSDMIISFGPNLAGENVYQAPLDFSFDRYEYQSEVAGVFNPNGFVLKEVTAIPCPVCGQDYLPE